MAPGLSCSTTDAAVDALSDGETLIQTVKVTLNDGSNTVEHTFDITIHGQNDAPIILAEVPDFTIGEDEDLPVFDLDTLVSTYLKDAEGDDLTLTLTLSYPSGSGIPDQVITLNPGDDLDWDAPADFNGVINVSLVATDEHGASDSDTFTVTVTADNDAPVIDYAGQTAFSMNEDGTFTLTSSALADLIANSVSDVDDDIADLTYSVTFTYDNGDIETFAVDPSVDFTFQPNQDYNGDIAVTVTVSDPDGESDTVDLTLTVDPVNDAPVIDYTGSGTYNIDEDGTVSISAATLGDLVADYVSDVDNDAEDLTYSVKFTYPNGDIVTMPVDPSQDFSYALPANFNGTVDVTIVVTDPDGATDELELDLVVDSINDDPVLDTLPDLDTDEDVAVHVDGGDLAALVADYVSDVEGDDITVTLTLTYPSGSGIADEIITINPGDDLDYTPPANFFGDVGVAVLVTDVNGGTDTGSFTLTVNGVNDAPEISAIPDLDMDEDEVVNVDGTDLAALVASYVSDADGDDLTVTLTLTYPSGSGIADQVITINPGDDLDYTPPANFHGDVSVAVLVEDGNGGSDTGSFVLTIDPINDDPTVSAAIAASVDENHLGGIDLLQNASDVDGDTLVVNNIALPMGVYIDGTELKLDAGYWDYLSPGQSVVLDINYDIEDGEGGSVAQTLQLTINGSGEVINGTDGDDPILGTNLAELINAGEGDDIVTASGGNDEVYGGEGDDTVSGGSGHDTIYGEDGDDQLAGGSGNDTVSGGEGDDLVLGDSGDDMLNGNAGIDTLQGGSNNDTLNGGADKDYLTGGSGNDIFVVGSASDSAVGQARDVITDFGNGVDKIDVSAIDASTDAGFQGLSFVGLGTADRTVAAGTMKYYVFNNTTFIVGSVDNDDQADFQIELTGNPALTFDSFIGLASNLVGTTGVDNLVGTARNEWMFGREGADTIYGGGGKDRLSGGDGADTFRYSSHTESTAGANRDVITDWQNVDKIDLSAMDANLTTGGTQGFAFMGEGSADRTVGVGELKYYYAGGNTYLVGDVTGDNDADFQIEITGTHVLEGSNFIGLASSAIVGTDSGETLTGTANADAIIGKGGNDTIIGLGGKDLLTGGTGDDTFVFQASSDSAPATRDTIMDFAVGDKIDLSAIDANDALALDQAFTFNGVNQTVGRSVGEGEVRFYNFGGNTYVVANSGTDNDADIQIEIKGTHTLTAADFVL